MTGSAAASPEELEACGSFLPRAQRHAAQMGIVLSDTLEPLLERRDALHLEADVIGTGTHDASARVIANVPWQEDELHAPIAQVEAGTILREELEAEHGLIEFREALG